MRKRRDPTAPVIESEQGFLTRWSRRKHDARVVADAVEEQPPPSELSPDPQQPAPVRDEGAPLTDADLPPLETLGEDSDYSGFLSPDVNEALRRRALRQLFASSQFHVRDGLDDYDDDYRNFESLGGIFTADMGHRLEMERKRLAQAESTDAGTDGRSDVDEQPRQARVAAASDSAARPAADSADEQEPQSG